MNKRKFDAVVTNTIPSISSSSTALERKFIRPVRKQQLKLFKQAKLKSLFSEFSRIYQDEFSENKYLEKLMEDSKKDEPVTIVIDALNLLTGGYIMNKLCGLNSNMSDDIFESELYNIYVKIRRMSDLLYRYVFAINSVACRDDTRNIKLVVVMKKYFNETQNTLISKSRCLFKLLNLNGDGIPSDILTTKTEFIWTSSSRKDNDDLFVIRTAYEQTKNGKVIVFSDDRMEGGVSSGISFKRIIFFNTKYDNPDCHHHHIDFIETREEVTTNLQFLGKKDKNSMMVISPVTHKTTFLGSSSMYVDHLKQNYEVKSEKRQRFQ